MLNCISTVRKWAFTAASALILSGCVTTTEQATRAKPADLDLPPIKVFSQAVPLRSQISNAALARDFLDLHFALENGTTLDRFSRFEGPIAVRLIAPNGAPTLSRDLSALLARLRNEAGIDIRQVAANSAAQVTIELVPSAELSRRAPNAACIVIPNVSSWNELKTTPRRSRDWRSLDIRTRISIFLPQNRSPQEARDCFHEELAQALGPPNDLFRLSNSVFNDDNFHSILTNFDMLVLKVTYAPELRSGMTRPEVVARLPALLSRINPAGRAVPANFSPPTTDAWRKQAFIALGGPPNGRTQTAARAAVAIARANGWNDVRLGLSLYLLGSHSLASDQLTAKAAFINAKQIFDSRPETKIHAARVALQLAVLAVADGDYQTALTLTDGAIPTATAAQNAALLATLMMARAEALDGLGRSDAARQQRLDSLGWARYGFGSADFVQNRLNEVAALANE